MDRQPDQVDDHKFGCHLGEWRALPKSKSREQRGVEHIGLGIDGLKRDPAHQARRGRARNKGDLAAGQSNPGRNVDQIQD